MEENEMNRFSFSFDHGFESDEHGDMVFYDSAMEIINTLESRIEALEAKISGMIEMPKVEMVPDPLNKEIHTLTINGQPITLFVDNIDEEATDVASESLERIEQALGMKGGSDGGV